MYEIAAYSYNGVPQWEINKSVGDVGRGIVWLWLVLFNRTHFWSAVPLNKFKKTRAEPVAWNTARSVVKAYAGYLADFMYGGSKKNNWLFTNGWVLLATYVKLELGPRLLTPKTALRSIGLCMKNVSLKQGMMWKACWAIDDCGPRTMTVPTECHHVWIWTPAPGLTNEIIRIGPMNLKIIEYEINYHK
jgi:hypothetical protein